MILHFFLHHLKKAFTEEPSRYNALVLMEMVSLTDVYVHLDFDWGLIISKRLKDKESVDSLGRGQNQMSSVGFEPLFSDLRE